MSNELGALIEAEVGRAESDLAGLRNRGQAVLTASGALVTLLAAVIAVAAGEDAAFSFSSITKGCAVIAMCGFVAAAVVVLIMCLPAGVDAPSSKELARYAKESWAEPTWEQDVAKVLSSYLISLRSANTRLAILLRVAIGAEVIGIASVAVMALSLLEHVK